MIRNIFYFLTLLFFTACVAKESHLIIWKNTTVIISETYTNINDSKVRLRNILDSINIINPNLESKSDSVNFNDFSIKLSDFKTPYFVAYIGSPLNIKIVDSCSNYLAEKGLYIEKQQSVLSKKVNDTTNMLLLDKNYIGSRKSTGLADGLWFSFISSPNTKSIYKTEQFNANQGFLDGTLKRYNSNEKISDVEQYVNGMLVDTSFSFNEKEVLYFMEVRSSDGLEIYKSIFYYPNSTQIDEYTDYQIGYKFTFYENGKIKSLVAIKELNKWGEELEFSEDGILIGRRKY